MPLSPLIPANLEKVTGEAIREEKIFFRVELPFVQNQGFVAYVFSQQRDKGNKVVQHKISAFKLSMEEMQDKTKMSTYTNKKHDFNYKSTFS